MIANVPELADEVRRIYEEDWRGPFPGENIRFLTAENNDGRFRDLYFDLDTYAATIAGYSSGPKRLLKLPEDKLREIKGSLTASFFEAYPQYKLLESQINELDTPDLYEHAELCERLRRKLLELLSVLLDER